MVQFRRRGQGGCHKLEWRCARDEYSDEKRCGCSYLENLPCLSPSAGYVAGTVSTEYIASEPSPTFSAHSNLHIYLEKRRLQARSILRANDGALAQQLAEEELQRLKGKKAAGPASLSETSAGAGAEQENERSGYRPDGQGPRVMIVGAEAAGKTSLIKFLANYALRSPAVCSLGAGKGKEKENAAQNGKEGGEDGDTQQEGDITGWWPVIVNVDPSEVSRQAFDKCA